MLEIEITGSRSSNFSVDDPSTELLFLVKDVPLIPDNDLLVGAFVESLIPQTRILPSAFFGNRTLVCQGIKLVDLGAGVWEGSAKYGRRQPHKTGDYWLGFDGTGGTEHIAISKETVGKYARTPTIFPANVVATPKPDAAATLTVGNQYYYVVTAVGVGESTASEEVTSGVIAGIDKKVEIKWDAVPTATKYRIYRREKPTAPVIATTKEPGGTLATGNYFFVVTAVGAGDTESVISNEDVEAVLFSDNNFVQVTWPQVAGALRYRVYSSDTTGVYNTPCLWEETELLGSDYDESHGFLAGAPGTLVGGYTDADHLIGEVNAPTLTFTDNGLPLLPGKPPTVAQAAGNPPDFKRAIDVNNDQVQGVDIVVPVFKLTWHWYPSVALMTEDKIVQLMGITGKVNSENWKGFKKGEVLFLGPTGQPRCLDDWEVGLHFVAAPNADALSVGDILNIAKKGHEYLWVRFAPAVGNESVLRIPKFAYVERVYDYANFAQIGIGV